MHVADGTGSESPPVRKSETLVSDHDGARKAKCAHDNGGRNMNGFEERQSLVKAFVNTRVELWSMGRQCPWKEHFRRLINSDTSGSVGPDVEEISLVREVKVA
jgi:hypothetical protein